MKQFIIIIALLTFIASCSDTDRLATLQSLETDVDTTTLNFEYPNLSTALNKAKESNSLVFIYVASPYCARCKKMERDVLPDTVVKNFINKNFISAKFYLKKTLPPLSSKSDEYKQLNKSLLDFMDEYDCDIAFPTFVIVDSNGELIKKKSGSMDAQEIIGFGKSSLSEFTLARNK